MLCAKSAEGANIVAEAVDIIAEIKAQKNKICMIKGVDSKIKVGNTSWLSQTFSIKCGATTKAAYHSVIGKNAKIK
jgi:hypothetical protein